MASFLICGKRLDGDDPSFARAMAVAHLRHERPRCLCKPDGVEMYVAKGRHDFVLKRMPYTGARHASFCRSYARDIPLAWIRHHASSSSDLLQRTTRQEFIDHNARHLAGLLSSLWCDAGLTRWQPGFEGRRSWATVRRHLLAVAALQDPEYQGLRGLLYVPEFFRVDDRDAINARRLATWDPARESTAGDGHGMFMIGELKKLLPANRNFEAIIRHVPDQAFELADALYRWISENLAPQLDLWAGSAEVRMIMAAWFYVPPTGKPVIEGVSLMPVSLQWLPVQDAADLLRVQRLVRDRCSFVVGQHHRPPTSRLETASAVEASAT